MSPGCVVDLLSAYSFAMRTFVTSSSTSSSDGLGRDASYLPSAYVPGRTHSGGNSLGHQIPDLLRQIHPIFISLILLIFRQKFLISFRCSTRTRSRALGNYLRTFARPKRPGCSGPQFPFPSSRRLQPLCSSFRGCPQVIQLSFDGMFDNPCWIYTLALR